MRKQRTRLSLWQAGNTLCPICLLEFSREDATAKNGRASIEHVPPLKAGKPHIRVLTCKSCNGEGGSWIDHATVELVKQEHAVDLHIGTRVYHMRAGLNRPAPAERLIEMTHPADLMHYARLRAVGLPVGSGVTEGACKSVIKMRTNGSSQRWRPTRLEAVLTLRSMHMSDRLPRFWANFARGYRQEVTLCA